jgi:hypothetical protein
MANARHGKEPKICEMSRKFNCAVAGFSILPQTLARLAGDARTKRRAAA